MRPGEIPLTPKPAEESRRPDVNCPTCGSAWHLDAAACGSCGWRLPLEGDPASATLCPLCHQSKSVDSLTNRCTRCYPIQIEELDSELQEYARRAQSERFRLFALGILLGPVAIVICLYYSKGSFSTPTLVALILTPVIMGASIYSLNRKGKLLR
ncbi:MAG: Double zinc ribbon [Blastocatellia bacterium]|nr:Double zinc ribbon [Blastocatellia bacterium]